MIGIIRCWRRGHRECLQLPDIGMVPEGVPDVGAQGIVAFDVVDLEVPDLGRLNFELKELIRALSQTCLLHQREPVLPIEGP